MLLWTKGLAHPNPAVQTLILVSFASRSWGVPGTPCLEPAFLRSSLLPCLAALANRQGNFADFCP